MQKHTLEAIATEMKAALDMCDSITPFTTRYPDFSIRDAYTVAHWIHERRLEEGWTPVGRKIGFTNPALWSKFGVREPVWATVYAHAFTQTTNSEAVCIPSHFSEPKIEPELVVHFSSAPPVTDSADDILQCVDWIALGFEVVQSHFPGWQFQAADTIAGVGLHGALYVGNPVPIETLGEDLLLTLASFEVKLTCNAELREIGRGANVMGNPLLAAAHLTSVLSNQQISAPIRAGEVVTTGTLTTPFSINPGEHWTLSAEGIALPGLALTCRDMESISESIHETQRQATQVTVKSP